MPSRSRTPWLGSLRLFWLLFLCSLIVPPALFGTALWQSRRQAFDAAEATATRTVLILQGHG